MLLGQGWTSETRPRTKAARVRKGRKDKLGQKPEWLGLVNAVQRSSATEEPRTEAWGGGQCVVKVRSKDRSCGGVHVPVTQWRQERSKKDRRCS